MFTSNVFAAVAQSLPAGFMKWYLCLMALAVVMLCLVPSISTSLPNLVMGPPSR